MFNRILVPLDGSEVAEAVLPYVSLLGREASLPIELLRVVDPSFSYMADFAHLRPQDCEARRMAVRAREYLEQKSMALQDGGLRVTRQVFELFGENPVSVIISEAEKESATLIALSTHGRSGIGRWALGSVTEKVLRSTSTPILINRARGSKTSSEAVVGKIIVPLDGSLQSEQALPYASYLANVLQSTILLVRVIPSALEFCSYMEYPTAEYENLSLTVHTQAMDYLKGASENLRQQGINSVQERLMFGNAASSITELVEQTPNCLVAMTSHGRSGLGRWVVGSVAERVVRHAEAPVLIIRPAE